MFTFLSLFACTEYGFHNKNGTNLGGGDSQSTSDGSGFDFNSDSLIEDEPEYNSLVGRVCSPTGGDWIVDAHVYVEVDTNDDGVIDYISEDYTNVEGFYTLNDLPEGEHIVYVSKGSFTKEVVVDVLPGTTELPFDVCALEQPSIAVVDGAFDHIEQILEELGIEYTLYDDNTASSMFGNLEQMETYDIIFINCGSNADVLNASDEHKLNNVRDFVNNGGSIYASDHAAFSIGYAFPDEVQFHGFFGVESTVEANIIDPTMQTILESSGATIDYDLSGWMIIDSISSNVEVLVSGDVQLLSYEHRTDIPLAVRYDRGEGTVVYTTFHNETQGTTFAVDKLLQEMIFSL